MALTNLLFCVKLYRINIVRVRMGRKLLKGPEHAIIGKPGAIPARDRRCNGRAQSHITSLCRKAWEGNGQGAMTPKPENLPE